MNTLVDAIATIAECVHGEAANLNRLDAIAGDGDLGVTMNIAADAVLELLPSLAERSTSDILIACGTVIARKAPSTSGTLLATGLLRAGRSAADFNVLDGNTIVQIIEAATVAIAERGGATAGSKTMLDALLPAVEAAKRAVDAGASVPDIFASAQSAAARGVEETRLMHPQFGRASWLAERSLGHPDAGASFVALLFASMAAYVARENTEREIQR